MGAELRAAVAARRRALERFSAWEAEHAIELEPSQALHLVGGLFELLPAASRRRPVDVSGIRKMREALAVLGRSS